MYKELRLSQDELEFLNQFRDAVNDLSLVLKHYYHDIPLTLILGDNSDTVLDLLLSLEKTELRIHKLFLNLMRLVSG